jgi:hypothetical protein
VRLEYVLREVDESVGLEIETCLHYMLAKAHSVIFRAGLFLRGCSHPIAYMAISRLDRRYKLRALEEALRVAVEPSFCANVSRVYGFGDLPRNTISRLTSFAARELVGRGVGYFVTAVNPFLGFNGLSMLSSGFRPYALCPVAYGYDSSGSYTPRRDCPSIEAALDTPPNILFVRGLRKLERLRSSAIAEVVEVPPGAHRQARMTVATARTSEPLGANLEALRSELEHAWDSLTRYHRVTVEPNDPISKGQCGVTSAYIARELSRQGHDVLFCEGDVLFPAPVKPIRNHCWVTVPRFRSGAKEVENLIIDLTADQSGFEEPVICEPEQALIGRGIRYQLARQVEPREAQAGHLAERLGTLHQRLADLLDE